MSTLSTLILLKWQWIEKKRKREQDFIHRMLFIRSQQTNYMHGNNNVGKIAEIKALVPCFKFVYRKTFARRKS